ncbi:hypothetical protein [Streptomyces sp. A1547]|uniref:hypothetical protein n=1 Tax=Streptomyces sp. A1547 TaxID=2563105 RepID=UPI00109E48E5|nr:hypothetical protein [Streptomyces sp. A1547]THA33480.1 hypothetical protein E6W17_31365 [Streptomyces sp. A1547]
MGGEIAARDLRAPLPGGACVLAGPDLRGLAVEAVDDFTGLLERVEVGLASGGNGGPGLSGIGAADQAQMR